MHVEEILEELESNRERLLVILERLPDEALLEPGAIGNWTIADTMSHLIAWESELITGLMRIDQAKKPVRLLAAFADVDEYNERRYTENQGRDLDHIFDDLLGVRRQLEGWLIEFSDQDLTSTKLYKWSKGLPLWHIIKENSFGHEAQHIPDIEAFADKWLTTHPA